MLKIAGLMQGFVPNLLSMDLGGVRLVISDAHEGLKKAIAAVLAGATETIPIT